MAKSIHLTGHVVANGAITPTGASEYLRILIIYDRQPEGSFPTISEFLTSRDQSNVAGSNSFSGMNMVNNERFLFLRDIRVAIPQNDFTVPTTEGISPLIDYTTNRVNINEFIKCHNLTTVYKSNSIPSQIPDISTGAFYFFCLGNLAPEVAAYQILWQIRYRYTDI